MGTGEVSKVPTNLPLLSIGNPPVTPKNVPRKHVNIRISGLANLVSIVPQTIGMAGAFAGNVMGFVVGGVPRYIFVKAKQAVQTLKEKTDEKHNSESVQTPKNQEDEMEQTREAIQKSIELGGKIVGLGTFLVVVTAAFPITAFSYILAEKNKTDNMNFIETFKSANVLFFDSIGDEDVKKSNVRIPTVILLDIVGDVRRNIVNSFMIKDEKIKKEIEQEIKKVKDNFFDDLSTNDLSLNDLRKLKKHFIELRKKEPQPSDKIEVYDQLLKKFDKAIEATIKKVVIGPDD